MPRKPFYQELFSSLKGTGKKNIIGFSLPIENTNYDLVPINCSKKYVDSQVVLLLTQARNLNSASFLTQFTATECRTKKWLIEIVAKEHNRILFMLKNISTKSYYGYMGLAFGNQEGTYIEADSVVRIDANGIKGLMKASLVKMITWVRNDLKISNVGVRVLSDNPAVKFYEKCGFTKNRREDLYEIKDASGKLMALSPLQQFVGQNKSDRHLCHLLFSKSKR